MHQHTCTHGCVFLAFVFGLCVIVFTANLLLRMIPIYSLSSVPCSHAKADSVIGGGRFGGVCRAELMLGVYMEVREIAEGRMNVLLPQALLLGEGKMRFPR